MTDWLNKSCAGDARRNPEAAAREDAAALRLRGPLIRCPIHVVAARGLLERTGSRR